VRTPESGWGNDWITPGQRQQILVACDQIVRPAQLPGSQQRAQHRLVIRIAQGDRMIVQRFDYLGLNRQNIDQIVDFGGCQAVPADQSRKHALQFVQDERRQNHLD